MLFTSNPEFSSVLKEKDCPEDPHGKILYSYGLFSCKPMTEKMKHNIDHNCNTTKLDYEVLGPDEVEEDLEYMEQILPGVTDAYYKIPRGVGKSDLARMISLYIRGGHYADLDVKFHCKPSIKTNAVILYTEHFFLISIFCNRIANYALSSPSGHPFILAIIEEIVNRINLSTKKHWSDRDVLLTTGPDVITYIYHKHLKLFKNDNCRVILTDFWKSKRTLTHQCAGSWRNNKDDEDDGDSNYDSEYNRSDEHSDHEHNEYDRSSEYNDHDEYHNHDGNSDYSDHGEYHEHHDHDEYHNHDGNSDYSDHGEYHEHHDHD